MAEHEKEKELNPKPSKIPRTTRFNDGFIIPESPRTRKQSKAQQQKSFVSPNPFEKLSEDEDPMDESEDNSSLASAQTSPQRRRKQPKKSQNKPVKPIIAVNTTFQVLKATLTTLKLSQDPAIRKRKGNDFSIMAANIEDKKLIVEKLKVVKYQHFTFTEQQDRHVIFALLGYFEVSKDVLLKDLQEAQIPAVSVVKANKSKEDPIYLISFRKDSITLSELQCKNNAINGLRVKWDKHRPQKRRPAQCHRCQRFGHAAINCSLPFRCVKCLETHAPGACKRISREVGLPSCVNCNAEGHASNSPRCPAFQKHIEFIKLKKKPPTRQREFPATNFDWSQHRVEHHFPSVASQPPPSTSNTPNVNREYRPSLSQPKTRSQPLTSDPFSQLSDLQNDLASIPDIHETIRLFAALVQELKSAKSQTERLAVLFKHLGTSSYPSHYQV